MQPGTADLQLKACTRIILNFNEYIDPTRIRPPYWNGNLLNVRQRSGTVKRKIEGIWGVKECPRTVKALRLLWELDKWRCTEDIDARTAEVLIFLKRKDL